jgi:hypothetical protein
MYIGRRPDGTIYGSWTCRQANDDDHLGIEEVVDDHPDLLAFTMSMRPVEGKSIDERLRVLETQMQTIESIKVVGP